MEIDHYFSENPLPLYARSEQSDLCRIDNIKRARARVFSEASRARGEHSHVIQYISLTFKALNAYSQRERGNKQRNTICSFDPEGIFV